ncbi:MAG: hypothetical protein ACTS27_07585 [Phycisphaerales bacterium]
MRMNVKAWSVLSCAVAVLSSSALAVPLAPGDQVNLSGTTAINSPWLPGVSQSGSQSFPFLITDAQQNPLFQGTLFTTVFRSNALGTLRFRHQIDMTQAVAGRSVTRVEVLGYTGFETNVDYRTDGSGSIGPNAASRTTSGAQVAFFFTNPPLDGGVESRNFEVFTNATFFDNTGQARITLNTGESVVLTGLPRPILTDCPGDTNGDGIVNFADLNTVLSEFGEPCN